MNILWLSRDPETALVGKLPHGLRLLREILAHRIELVRPARGREIAEHLPAVGQVHERAPDLVLKITIAKLEESRVLLAAHPARGLEPPHRALRRRKVPVVRRDEQPGTGRAGAMQLAQRRPAVLASGDLH